jgi:histidinol-phosphate aminotransferase
MSRSVVAAMTAYTLELREAEVKLNQNESPFDVPRELKERALALVAERPWNLYPDFESLTLREAIANAHGLASENVLVGNGSNELLAATIATFVGPGTPVVIPKPTFALYEKLVTVAGGTVIPIDIDPTTGLLPLDAILHAIQPLTRPQLALSEAEGVTLTPHGRERDLARECLPSPREAGRGVGGEGPVIIVCSPNNPTGGVLPPRGIETLLASGATVLFDRAYGDFALDLLPPLNERLVTFSTFSKAWGLAALRVGWLATTAATAREIRKVKLPYSLNIISEAIAVAALENAGIRKRTVANAISERNRMFEVMRATDGVTPFPSAANFIFFRVHEPKRVFDELCARGVLIREYANALRVSVGTPEQNDRFLNALGAADALARRRRETRRFGSGGGRGRPPLQTKEKER